MAELAEKLVVNERRVKNMQLRAPTSGTIDQLKTYTIGSIATARKDLMRIVPNDSQPEIEAVFSNVDVGFLEIGQQANIKLDAFPAERFGFVRGRLYQVSADSQEVADGQWGFTVRITPDKPYLETPTAQYELRAGMSATVDVITGERSLISYFFAPILRTISDSLGER